MERLTPEQLKRGREAHLLRISFESMFADDYGHFASLADLFRQIGYDERVHKEESLARVAEARFR